MIPGPNQPPRFVLSNLHEPNPLAFLASKQAEPTKIATSCVRLFLGVRLECAQCHDHPFDRWTQRQFWSQAAFFAGIQRRGKGSFAPLVESIDPPSIRMAESKKIVPAALLDGSQFHFDPERSPREDFAKWMTSPQNPFFARTIVNRIWAQLMGRGFVNPIDDFRESNPPSHPELLHELADDFAASGFDLTRLYRALCLTDAYQRTSRQTRDDPQRTELFAVMSIKPLSADQFYDSYVEAVGHEQSDEAGGMDEDRETNRRKLLRLFSSDAEAGYPKTSVTQALLLMNSSFVHEAVTLPTAVRLKQTLNKFPDAADRQVEALYLATLSRYPGDDEKRMMAAHIASAPAADRPRRLGDVLWVLLNSAEFRWNH
jgi:hypothetical protein